MKKNQEEQEDSDEDDDEDIEAQIQRELAGLKPAEDKTDKSKRRPVEVTRLEMPCGSYSDISITPKSIATGIFWVMALVLQLALVQVLIFIPNSSLRSS